jgi:hypothetical protein
MTAQNLPHVFLSYSEENQDFVESLARRLQGDARLSFWFGPWHSKRGVPIQEQMEEALGQAQSCAVFSSSGRVEGWQNQQMRAAIQARVGDEPGYCVIPVLLSGTAISGDEMTEMLREIQAGRLLVLFDSCHSGGAGDPKGSLPQVRWGLSEGYYEALAQGRGRVVIASSRPGEDSWGLHGMRNSLFTHYLLEALRGEGRTLGTVTCACSTSSATSPTTSLPKRTSIPSLRRRRWRRTFQSRLG